MNNNIINKLLKLSKRACKKGNVPIAAAVVKKSKIISSAYNTKNSKNISVNHAEIIVIRKACKKLNKWILDDCDIYVTLEPCNMCLNAIAESRIKNVYYLLDTNYFENQIANVNKIQKIKIETNGNYQNIFCDFFKKLRL